MFDDRPIKIHVNSLELERLSVLVNRRVNDLLAKRDRDMSMDQVEELGSLLYIRRELRQAGT